VTGESLADPARRELAARVEVVVDAEFEKAFPEQALAWVEIETTEGRRARSKISAAPGDADMLSRDRELTEKLKNLTDPVLGPDHAKKLASAIERLPDSPNVNDMTGLLCPAAAPAPRRAQPS
jgi:2-methylcitrate dehydratase PrpD